MVVSLIWLAGAVLLIYGLHRLALVFERRGWLYYRNVRPRGSAIVALGAALDPTIRRIMEAQEEEHGLEEDESGDLAKRRRHLTSLLRFPDR